MGYTNLPGVKATYLDGAFKIPNTTTQPSVLVVGPAESGKTNEIFRVREMSGAENEFGAESALMRVAHEVLVQGANNISVMRCGGRAGTFVLTDSDTATLTIVPEYKDNAIFERYALFISNDGSVNRYLVYDIEDEEWVYDSLEEKCVDSGIISIVDSGIDLFTLNDIDSPDEAISLADVVTGDLTADGTATVSSVVATEGSDGTSVSNVEAYAALNTGLHTLDYKDADFVIPVDVYLDAPNIAEDTSAATYGYYWKGLPVKDTLFDKLGFLWQYIYRGSMYTYFTDTSTYFSVSKAAASKTVNTDLVITALKDGKGGNACTLQIASGALGAVISENINGGIDIFLNAVTGTTTNSVAASTINSALAAYTTTSGVLASTLLSAAGGSTVIAAIVAKSNFTGGTGGHVLTHADLTGEAIPSGVSTRFSAGADAELRECNFGHQLASFCSLASEYWSTMCGAISFSEPTGYDRTTIAGWVGNLPTYTDATDYSYIDSPGDNGYGILGNKFLAGQSATSNGYRSHLVVDGNSTDGYAHGGFIMTKGKSLPNGESFPYGIKSSDEAVDANNKPVDIGKHLFVTYGWDILTNNFNGGSSYRGSEVGTLIGKLATMDAKEEPISRNGIVKGVSSPARIHSSQLDDLAGIRAIGIRREDGYGFGIINCRTAAHPDSDWTRCSTIRSVNRQLKGLRDIAKNYQGKPFTQAVTLGLENSMNQYLFGEQQLGYNSGFKLQLNFSRADKIIGNLRVKLKIIPPFSIEFITVETSLAVEESDL